MTGRNTPSGWVCAVLDTKATEHLERLGNLLKLGTCRNRAVEDEWPVFRSLKTFSEGPALGFLTTEMWRGLHSVSKIFTKQAASFPIFPLTTCKSRVCSPGGSLSFVNGQILPREVVEILGSKQSLIHILPHLLRQPQPHGTQAHHVLGPRQG